MRPSLVLATALSALLASMLLPAVAPVAAADRSAAHQTESGMARVKETFPGENGRIVFAKGTNQAREIYTMNPDGTGKTRLTDNAVGDELPAWSPDGTRIAFSSNRNANTDVYVMDADGTDQTRLTTHAALDGWPAWSPDGARIAFVSTRDAGDYEIYVMDADGTDQTRLTTHGSATDDSPDWSPDGTRIAFTSEQPGAGYNYEIFTMDPDGTDQTRLTDVSGMDVDPSWSPDGTSIAFASNRHGDDLEVYTMDADGTDAGRLTDGGGDSGPSWSPDGTRIAFFSARDGSGYEIYTMDADGTDQTRLTSNAVSDYGPDWQPAAVEPLTGVLQVSAGGAHTCAVVTGGQVRCWGANNGTGSFTGSGMLGDGTTLDRSRPVVVSNPTGTGPLTGVTQVSAGGGHTCARLDIGQVVCWGVNNLGVLGDGTFSQRLRPVPVSNSGGTGPLTGIAEISAGDDGTCARKTNGQVRCWGTGDLLGNGAPVLSTRPVTVSNPAGTGALTGVTQLSVGGAHACAAVASGQVRCWGNNALGALGDGTTTSRYRPVTVSNPAGTGALSGIVQVAAGTSFQTCALKDSGQVRCWGGNASGELGDGTTTSRYRPVTVSNPAGTGALSGITQVSAGTHHGCATTTEGRGRCWGRNTFGDLGDGTTTNRLRPVAVSDPAGIGYLTSVTWIDAGGSTVARLDTAQARGWGANASGQVGDATTANRSRPVVVVSV